MDMRQFSQEAFAGMPMNVALADFILQQIADGRLQVGDKLPNEREIAAKTGLSRGTVRTAFARLEKMGVLQIKKGSGSFVKQIPSEKAVRIAIVGNCLETLLDLKAEIDSLKQAETYLFLMESISTAADPKRFLDQYDLCLVPQNYKEQFLQLAEGMAEKLFFVSTVASEQTRERVLTLDLNARIGIICRSNEFLATVKGTLITYGFSPDNILSFFEMDYTTKTYFPGGIDALLSFSTAHIFTSHHFHKRNEQFLQKGGKIIPFVSVLGENNLTQLKANISQLKAEEGLVV